MGAGYRPEDHDALQDAWAEQRAIDEAYPVTRRSLERLAALVKEAGEFAASVRDSGPSAVRFEASNLVAGLADVDELLRDLNTALQMARAG